MSRGQSLRWNRGNLVTKLGTRFKAVREIDQKPFLKLPSFAVLS